MSRHTEQRRIFETEMIPHRDVVYRYLLFKSGSEADAKDLCQETFTRAYVKIDKYREGTHAKAWLLTIATNLFINFVRSRKRRATSELDERVVFGQIDDSNAFATYDEDLSDDLSRGEIEVVDADLFNLDVGDELRRALALLSPEARAILLMSDLLDYSEKEIAEHFGLNLNTVKGKIRRSRLATIRRTDTFAEEKYGIITTRNLG